MSRLIILPDVSKEAASFATELPDQFHAELERLHEALSAYNLRSTTRRDDVYGIELRHWVSELQDGLLELRTALAYLHASIVSLSSVLPGQYFTPNHKTIRSAVAYFGSDAAARLVTTVDRLAQLLNVAYPPADDECKVDLTRVVKRVADADIAKAVAPFTGQGYKDFKKKVRHTFVHRDNPMFERTTIEEATIESDGDVVPIQLVTAKREAMDPQYLLRECLNFHGELDRLGAQCVQTVVRHVERCQS